MELKDMANQALLITCLYLFVTLGNVMRADEQLPDGAQVLAELLGHRHTRPVISPDGTRLAFVSGRKLYLHNFGDAAPQAIEDAHSFYALIKDPAVDLVELSFDAAAAGSRDNDLSQDNADVVFESMSGLAWTADSRALRCAIAQPPNPESNLLTYCVRPIDGKLQALATPPKPPWYGGRDWQLTCDRRFLILRQRDRSLIWHVESNRPVATPYYALSPSPTSDRWIGIEKDSWRFVILDKNMKVLERTTFTAPRSRSVFNRQLQWSCNEQFVLYHHQIGMDHYNNWVGIWLDLKSGNQQEIEGLTFRDDRIAFTGQNGTWGIMASIGKNNERILGYHVFGRYLEVRKPKELSVEVLWRYEERWRPNQHRESVLAFNRKFTQFVFTKPDSGAVKTRELLLVDRDHQKTQLAVLDTSKGLRVVGFANGDRELVIVSNGRLISLQLPIGKMESQIE
jgi:hypothetical protein